MPPRTCRGCSWLDSLRFLCGCLVLGYVLPWTSQGFQVSGLLARRYAALARTGGPSPSLCGTTARSLSRQDSSESQQKPQHLHTLPPDLVHDLDLAPLVKKVAAYTATRRGRQALLSWIGGPTPDPRLAVTTSSARARRVAQVEASFRRESLYLPIAQSQKEAQQVYDRVEQAQFVLHNTQNVSLPPIYGADVTDGPLDTTRIRGKIISDDDEWLDLPTLEWTLQDILKAEQIIDVLLRVAAWSRSTTTSTWVPLLTDVASGISFSVLEQIQKTIAGAVEIVRIKTVTDPSGRSSFHFRLSESHYPVLRLLRRKEKDLAARVVKDAIWQSDLTALREEMEEKEDYIRLALCKSIADHRLAIDKALMIIAQLDVLMAKAAFAVTHGGVVPRVVAEGTMAVKAFAHPLIEGHEAVPISLQLGMGKDCPNRALVISGPNGGGKTLAMKSFGLVGQMVKLGLPIPIRTDERPVVGFFDQIITALGDRQSVTSGQSTFMAQLSTFATTLESLEGKGSDQTLVLLDELGSGTESDGGGAIGQAVLEHMLESRSCRIVATTHSPRLKALSFDDDRFACATVLLEENTGLRLPSYRLEYGLIGESFALDAASRSNPKLPASVLRRATDLCRSNESLEAVISVDVGYMNALTASLAKEKALVKTARQQAEHHVEDMAQCRAAMMRLAGHYDQRLDRLVSRVTECYEQMKGDTDSLELLGDTLDQIRVVKKRVQSDTEKLRDRGLRVVADFYALSPGESVVVIAGEENAWDGVEGQVVEAGSSDSCQLAPNEVLVAIYTDPLEESQRVVFQRYQLAIWDYDSVFDDWNGPHATQTISHVESKRRLSGLLSSLDSTTSSPRQPGDDDKSQGRRFTSSRERKASKKKGRKK